MTSDNYARQIKKLRPLPNPRQCLPPKRIRLDVESGADSLAGIFQDDQGSITQDLSDDIDSLVTDVIDLTDCNDRNSMNQG